MPEQQKNVIPTQLTRQGLFVPIAAYQDWGEVEIVRTEQEIVIHPKTRRKVTDKLVFSLPAYLEIQEDGSYLAVCPLLSGCHALGDTVGEALTELPEVTQMLLDAMREHGQPIPPYFVEFDAKYAGNAVIVELVEAEPA